MRKDIPDPLNPRTRTNTFTGWLTIIAISDYLPPSQHVPGTPHATCNTLFRITRVSDDRRTCGPEGQPSGRAFITRTFVCLFVCLSHVTDDTRKTRRAPQLKTILHFQKEYIVFTPGNQRVLFLYSLYYTCKYQSSPSFAHKIWKRIRELQGCSERKCGKIVL